MARITRTSVLLVLPLALALAGCGGASRDSATTQKPTAEATPAAEVRWDAFGAPIADAAPLPAADVMAAPEKFAGQTILVEGNVSEVCQAKGCWMTMKGADTEMRIRFKDYGFFVPKDCAGRTARMEGVVTVEMTSVEEARHYLEDAGKHEEAEKITEPVKSITFMASGVRLKA